MRPTLDAERTQRLLELPGGRRCPDDPIAAVGAKDPEAGTASCARCVVEEVGELVVARHPLRGRAELEQRELQVVDPDPGGARGRDHSDNALVENGEVGKLREEVDLVEHHDLWPRVEPCAVLGELTGKPFFLLPLQLSGDYQIRSHSPFPDMRAAAAYVIESFARHAPEEAHLLIKAHPFDTSLFNWRRYIRRRARALGLAERVHFIDGGNLEQLAADTAGMVCVNSTSATLALAAGSPVCTLGEAIYKVPGLTFSRHVDEFWSDPLPPEPGLYGAFRRVLVDRCLVRGGIASESAVRTLIEAMLPRLGCEAQTAEPVFDPVEMTAPVG